MSRKYSRFSVGSTTYELSPAVADLLHQEVAYAASKGQAVRLSTRHKPAVVRPATGAHVGKRMHPESWWVRLEDDASAYGGTLKDVNPDLGRAVFEFLDRDDAESFAEDVKSDSRFTCMKIGKEVTVRRLRG